MNGKSLTLELPQSVLDRLEKRAHRAERSVEAEIRELVTTSLDQDEDEVKRILGDLEPMENWAEADLVRAIRNMRLRELSERMADFNWKQQAEGLTPQEQEIAETLLKELDKCILVRSQALLVLKNRGKDIEQFLGVV